MDLKVNNLAVNFIERSVGRVPTTQTTARVGSGDALPRVLDISPRGLKALFPSAVEQGSQIALEIVHPSLDVPINVIGEVRWTRPDPDGKGALAGISFLAMPPAPRARLARLIGVELGRRVLVGDSAVGFAATGGDAEEALFLYDGALKLRAVLRRDGSGYKLERLSEDLVGLAQPVETLADRDVAIRHAFDREGPVRFEPELP